MMHSIWSDIKMYVAMRNIFSFNIRIAIWTNEQINKRLVLDIIEYDFSLIIEMYFIEKC